MSHVFHPSILREYDIRGVVGRTLHAADAMALGRSFATRVRRPAGRGSRSAMTVGCPRRCWRRRSSRGCARAGRCRPDRPRPQPMLYYAEATLEVDGAVQVTGSHNPGDHNGFKMVLGHQCVLRRRYPSARRDGRGSATGPRGRAPSRTPTSSTPMSHGSPSDAVGAYRVGWDCGNGAAGPVIEQLVKLLPGEHHLLFTDSRRSFSQPCIPTPPWKRTLAT